MAHQVTQEDQPAVTLYSAPLLQQEAVAVDHTIHQRIPQESLLAARAVLAAAQEREGQANNRAAQETRPALPRHKATMAATPQQAVLSLAVAAVQVLLVRQEQSRLIRPALVEMEQRQALADHQLPTQAAVAQAVKYIHRVA
jgi:hypothetical protein